MLRTIVDRLNKPADKISPFYGKKYGELTYSGTLALEAAIVLSGKTSGRIHNNKDFVLIPENVCYRVLLGVIRAGRKVLIVNPANKLFLTPEDVVPLIKKYSINTFILVHSWGLPVDIDRFRKRFGRKYIIIEDAALAWNLKSKGNTLGNNSDFVVTSFGKSKPASIGLGGAVFSNDKNLSKWFDYSDKESRISNHDLLPYLLPNSLAIDISKLKKEGDDKVSLQRKIANELLKGLSNTDFDFWQPPLGDEPTWHRFPIWTSSKRLFTSLLELADKHGIVYELPYKLGLSQTPLAKKHKCVYVNNNKESTYLLLLKTRKNKLNKIHLWLKDLKNLKK